METGNTREASELSQRLFTAIRTITSVCYKLTLRKVVNKSLQAKFGVSLGDETKYSFLTDDDVASSDKLVETFMKDFGDLID